MWLKNFAKINPKFLEYVILSPFMKEIIDDGRGTTVSTLTIVKTKNLLIPLPPLEEQSRIVRMLNKLKGRID